MTHYEVDAAAIRFEITETALMKDHRKATIVMEQLTDLGVALALDDFGTGYSSLGYLKTFPISIIKIDRSFVNDIGIDSYDEAIIDVILVITKSLNMSCIAEGVETEEQLNYLIKRGCYSLQGFKFSKPLPADEVLLIMDKSLR